MAFAGDSIYWVEVEKVVPNPFQPRREFDENKLKELGESIRMYGVLQPLTVTRKEIQREDGTFYSEYELIAGERRLRASKLAGTAQVPVIIREGEDSEQEKLELAIIENLQREDLNAIDRALAFQQLAEQFELTHVQVAQKVGRSREYVANSIRLLNLPEHMRIAVQQGGLGEGHARTLLMLTDKPEEQETLFRETLLKKLSVRELERIARKIATDKVRKPHKEDIDAHLIEIEKEFTETLGTRVQILKTDFGGRLTIDYFSDDDLDALLKRMKDEQEAKRTREDGAASISETPQRSIEPPTQHDMVDRLASATPLAAVPDAASPQPASEIPPSPKPIENTDHTDPPETTESVESAKQIQSEGTPPPPIPAAPERAATVAAPAWPTDEVPDNLPKLEKKFVTSVEQNMKGYEVPTSFSPLPSLHTEEQTTTEPAVSATRQAEAAPSVPLAQPKSPTQTSPQVGEQTQSAPTPPKAESVNDDDDDLYSMRNFTV